MIAIIIILGTLTGDFDIARENYGNGYYSTARAFFEEFVSTNPNDIRAPEATYYLIKIYAHDGDFIKFLPAANKYLSLFNFNINREEVFNLVLRELVEQKAFVLAYDYIKRYEYLTPDSLLLDDLCLELANQGYLSETILELAPDNDSLKILHAAQAKTAAQKEEIYRNINGTNGQVLLAEHHLHAGDTLRAARVYETFSEKEINDDLLYRVAKIALIFNRDDFNKLAARLASDPRFSKKVKILRTWTGERLDAGIVPDDAEELTLLLQVYRSGILDTISIAPPESLNVDSLFADTADLFDRVSDLRAKYADNYFLDSLYCEMLLRKNRIKEAYQTAEKYIKYRASQRFVRKVRAFKYYQERNYAAAVNDIMLSGGREPYLKYLHAECLRNLGEKPTRLYQEVMKTTKDSVLHFLGMKGYVEMEFEEGRFAGIAEYPIESLAEDPALTRIYLLSNVRIGRRAAAESLYRHLFGALDNDYLDAWGEHLIGTKLYARADSFYDSLASAQGQQLYYKHCYNRALVPFLMRDYARSEVRFDSLVKRHKGSGLYYSALFKIATIKYLKDDYETAGDYYGMASADSSLRLDGLENQLIAYKKAENWKGVMQTGRGILEICPETKKEEIYFEIGYAALRTGNAKEGIHNLRRALLIKPSQECHYWLGEAYLGTGEFLRALYQYQKILNDFPEDEMWYPTSWFKSGLAVELLGDTEEAKRIYQDIIKRRGPDDVWSSEAKMRLESLQ